MNSYSADSAIIASAENAVFRGETVFTPLLPGLLCTWRQRRLFEAAFYAAQGVDGMAEAMNRFRAENYRG